MAQSAPIDNSQIEALYRGLPCGKLVLKLASSEEERLEVFKLRYKVFNEELGEGLPESQLTGLDQDAFDKYCDHLMVMSGANVIGTYRLLHGPSRPPAGFYTETEFQLKGLGLDTSLVVELGRGCIRSDFRKQTTLISLFWGLHRYMLARRARYLMGCASLPVMNHNSAEASFQELVSLGKVKTMVDVDALPKNTFSGDAKEGTSNIPPLVRFYLEFGAMVIGRPAFDPVFKCHDLLMLFDMAHLSTWGTGLLERFDKRLSQGTTSSQDE